MALLDKKDKYKTTIVFTNGEQMHLPLNFHDINNLTKTNSKWILIEKYMFNTDLCKDSSTSISGGGIARHIK